MEFDIVILAAGKGKRMHSAKPKVLHEVAGKPMLQHVIETGLALSPQAIHVVYGHGGHLVKEALATFNVNWVVQDEQLGTGHAVLQALPFIPAGRHVLILSGDVPNLSVDTLQQLLNVANNTDLALLSATFDNPYGFGRIVRANDRLCAIVEEKDATPSQKQIKEIFTGVMVATVDDLNRWLPALKNNNAQNEYYLTDIVAKAVEEEKPLDCFTTSDAGEVQGVNDLLQRQQVERDYQRKNAARLMKQGVTIVDASRIDIRGKLVCGQEVTLDVNTVFEGKVILEDGVVVRPNCILKNCTIKKGAVINEFSAIEGAIVGEEATVGPFARLRPETELGPKSKVGNFVEIKKSVLAAGAKANHLSYIGDAVVGKAVNIGAGTITCNYDGKYKHKTVIEEGAFIGSGTQLVAPIHVGKNATLGAGTTLRKNAPADKLTLTLSEQRTMENWRRKD